MFPTIFCLLHDCTLIHYRLLKSSFGSTKQQSTSFIIVYFLFQNLCCIFFNQNQTILIWYWNIATVIPITKLQTLNLKMLTIPFSMSRAGSSDDEWPNISRSKIDAVLYIPKSICAKAKCSTTSAGRIYAWCKLLHLHMYVEQVTSTCV